LIQSEGLFISEFNNAVDSENQAGITHAPVDTIEKIAHSAPVFPKLSVVLICLSIFYAKSTRRLISNNPSIYLY
jgi:hypothetical protein